MYTCICVYVEAGGKPHIGTFLEGLGDRRLYWSGNLLGRLDWLTSKPQIPRISDSHRHVWLFFFLNHRFLESNSNLHACNTSSYWAIVSAHHHTSVTSTPLLLTGDDLACRSLRKWSLHRLLPHICPKSLPLVTRSWKAHFSVLSPMSTLVVLPASAISRSFSVVLFLSARLL